MWSRSRWSSEPSRSSICGCSAWRRAIVLPYTWAAFGVAAIAGGLMFASNATTYAYNFYFQGKLLLMGLAGLNMAIFHLFTGRHVARWGTAERTPLGAKAAGAVSLALWIGVVAFGRTVGFTLH